MALTVSSLAFVMSGAVVMGRFSQLSVNPAGRAWGHTFTLDVEKGFKVHALVPAFDISSGRFGLPRYAGFFTAEVERRGDVWPLFKEPGEGTEVLELDENHIVVAKRLKGKGFSLRLLAEAWVGLPAIWLSLEVLAGSAKVRPSLVGYGWAKAIAPTKWWAPREGEVSRSKGASLRIEPRPSDFGVPLVSFKDGPVTGALVFVKGVPKWVEVSDEAVRWGPFSLVEGERVTVSYVVLPFEADWEAVSKVTSLCVQPPEALEVEFGADERGPFVKWNIQGGSCLPLPPSVEGLPGCEGIPVPGAWGTAWLKPAKEATVRLPVPEEFFQPMVRFEPKPEVAKKVADLVAQVLPHQKPEGSFIFSHRRAFYDGLTCSALSLALPYLPSGLRERTAKAVRRCLDRLWEEQVENRGYGVWLFPEQEGFTIQPIDYPEIAGCVLYATLAYSLNLDRSYAEKRWPEAERHLRQIRKFTDWTGAPYAHPGPEYIHIIGEGVIGGYIAWASLYHLAKLCGEREVLGELMSRAALSWRAFDVLFRWRPEFGDGLAYGFLGEGVDFKVRVPWDYVEKCWFCFVPLFRLPFEDRFGVWRRLSLDRWWEYTAGKSLQRAYDFVIAVALSRAGRVEEARKHWKEIEGRPFWFDHFDHTPVLAIPAYLWLDELGL